MATTPGFAPSIAELEPESDAGRTSIKKSHRAEGINFVD
jgi:hypothetical protein